MTFRPRPPTMEALLAELAQRVRNLEEAHLGHTSPTGQWLLEDRDGNLWRRDSATGISYPVPLGVIAKTIGPSAPLTALNTVPLLLMRVQKVVFRTGHSYSLHASVRAISGGAGNTPASATFRFAWTSLVYTAPTAYQWSGDEHHRRGAANYWGGHFVTWYDHTGPPLVVSLWVYIVASCTTSVTVFTDSPSSGLWVVDEGPILPASLVP